jgi:tetratricopeptide (TPR) repeat protein
VSVKRNKIYWSAAFFYGWVLFAALNLFSGNLYAQQDESLPPARTDIPSRQADAMYYDAVKARLKGDDKIAEGLLEQVIKLKPDGSGAYYDLARLNMKLNRTDKAAEYIKKAIALEGNNPWYQGQYAEILLQGNKFEEAAGVYDKLAKQEKFNQDYLLKSAMLYQHSGKLKESLEALDKIIEKEGEEEELMLQKQQLYLKMNDLDKAVKTIEKLIEKNPGIGKYYALLGEMYVNNNQPEKAKDAYEKAEKKFPEDPAVQLSLADYYRKQKNEAKYHEYVRKGILNKTLDAETQLALLEPYMQEPGADSNRRKDALKLASEIVTQHKDDARVLAVYGNLLFLNDDKAGAVQQFKKSVAIDPSIYGAWRNLLYLYTDRSDVDSLLLYSERALKVFPNQAELHYLRGIGYFNKKDNAGAIRSLNRAADMQPEDNTEQVVRIYSMLGDVYNAAKQYELSDSCYDKVLRLDPENASVMNNYAYYLSLRGNRLNDAERMSKRTLELRPGEATFMDTYGWVLYKQAKYEKAKEYIQKAVDANPQNADGTLWEHLGDVYYKLNNAEKAVEFWKKAREKGTDSPDIDKKIREGKLYE